jgi:hypothetical protein
MMQLAMFIRSPTGTSWMESKELEPAEFSLDKSHARKQAIFGGVVVVCCAAGLALGWGAGEHWLGVPRGSCLPQPRRS